MEIRQVQKLAQKLTLTPQMRQSLHILQLPALELKEFIEKEIEENPVLEKEPQEGEAEAADERIDFEDTFDDGILQNYPSPDLARELDKKKEYKEALITQPVTLQELLLRQLHMTNVTNRQSRIAECIIYQIDDNGYLTLSLDEIAAMVNKEKAEEIGDEPAAKKEVEDVLSFVQRFEPAGVGARSLKECLLLQLDAMNNRDKLIRAIVAKHLSDVARNKVRVIARKLKVKPDAVRRAIDEISHLEPKPGRLCWTPSNITSSPSYPDIILERSKSGFEVIITSGYLPKFHISAQYKKILKSGKVSKETKDYIRKKVRSAQELKKSISLRDTTLRRVAQAIIDVQSDFLEEGEISLLKPLTFRSLARRIGRNESTVSRVVNAKYIQTPHGVFRLNRFFTKPLKDKSTRGLSREYIKSKIFNIIGEEDAKKPYDDAAIARMIKAEGVAIARRTVAKYREELKIPPAHRRRKKK